LFGVHAIMILAVAPKVAEMFRSDPKIANLLDPAIYIAADDDGVIASVVERLELLEVVSRLRSNDLKPIWEKSPEEAPIAILVTDECDVAVYRVADPRTCPDQWPWMGIEDDDD
jgi:hypothetical protein